MEKRKQKNSVFYISLILIAIMAVWSVAFNESFTKVSDAAFAFLTTDFGWLYLLAMIVFSGVRIVRGIRPVWENPAWRR